MTVTGVVRTPSDLGANAGGPIVYLPPGFLRAHPDAAVAPGFAMVRLDGGDGAVGQFIEEAEVALGDEPSFTAGVIADEGRSVDRAVDVEATSLRIISGLLVLASLAMFVQLIFRAITAAGSEEEPLRVFGMVRWQRVGGLVGADGCGGRRRCRHRRSSGRGRVVVPASGHRPDGRARSGHPRGHRHDRRGRSARPRHRGRRRDRGRAPGDGQPGGCRRRRAVGARSRCHGAVACGRAADAPGRCSSRGWLRARPFASARSCRTRR